MAHNDTNNWSLKNGWGFYDDKTFVVLDIDYTSWEGSKQRNWTGENEYKEIVQLGAIKVDRETLEEVDHLILYIKPRNNPVLSDHFVKVTGITNEYVQQNGTTFEDMMKRFSEFAKHQLALSYGNDGNTICENAGYYNASDFGFDSIYFANLVPFFRKADPETAYTGSGTVAKHFGVALSENELTEHDTLNDCRSLLNALRYLVQEKGMPLPF